MKKIVIFTCLMLSLSLAGSAFAAVLIDLDAAGLPEGDLTSWTNAGTAGGTFLTADVAGDEVTDPNAVVVTIDGKKAVYFADGAWMESDITTPAALTGTNSPWTIMVWADANSVAATGEDSMFQWADRGGDGGNAAHFNFGDRACTFWDDVFYTNSPPADEWVHLAATYDGTDVKLYVNGLPDTVEAKTLNMADGDYMRIARAMPDVYGMHPFTGAIASIQVHDTALSRVEVQNAMGEFVEAGALTTENTSLMEGNGTGSITLQIIENNLTSAGPTSDLEVTLSFVDAYADASLGTSAVGDPYVVTVPAATYSDPITIPIVAEDDEILEGTHNVLIQAVVTAGDPDYQAATILPVAGLAVKIVDNDYNPCPDPGLTNGSYIDEFDCSWDYGQGVTGLWDGIMNPTSFDSMNANVEVPGELYLSSTALGNWSGADNTGPYLYKEVTGDFVVEIKADADNWEEYACGGLLIRNPNATNGEDNIIVSYWPTGWGFDNLLWLTDDDARTEDCVAQNNAPYLRVERRDNEFWLSFSSDGVNWTLFPISSTNGGNPHVRDDLNVATLQVGIFQSYADWAGQNMYYDYFKLTPTRGTISGTLNLTESTGDSGMVQLQLDTEGFLAPLADIDVTLSAVATADADPNSDPNDVLIGDALKGEAYTITIPAADYANVQDIQVTAFVDAIPEPDQQVTLMAEVASADPNWNGVMIASVAVINILETPGLLLDTGTGVTAAEGGADGSFTVRLKIPPQTTPVVVDIADDADPDQVTTSPAQLSFDGYTWKTPQTVTVTAVDDAVLETDPHGTTLSLATTNGDEYDALDPVTVDVTIVENECGAWSYLWADFDTDCDVDIDDLSILAAAWLDCTMPYDPGCVDVR